MQQLYGGAIRQRVGVVVCHSRTQLDLMLADALSKVPGLGDWRPRRSVVWLRIFDNWEQPNIHYRASAQARQACVSYCSAT